MAGSPFRSLAERREPPTDAGRLHAAIASTRLFASLPADVQHELAQRVTLRQVRSGSAILLQNDRGGAMFIIETGRVKLSIFGEDGSEVILALLRPGDAFGETSLFDGDGCAASCIAMEPTSLMVLSREDVISLIHQHPSTALNLLGEMARRLRRADDAVAQFALCDVRHRLMRVLALLARDEGMRTTGGLWIRRRPTQQELANMIGASRETISRLFKALASEKLIIARGRTLIITDLLVERMSAGTAPPPGSHDPQPAPAPAETAVPSFR
jgi:CRP-like cAMP-binding protein